MSDTTISTSTQQTQDLAASLLSTAKERVYALIGDLGSGKTVFTQGLGVALGLKRLLSPTYIFIRQYPVVHSKYRMLYHIDLYRLKDQEEARSLGLEEILADPENLVIIEWPEKIFDLLPSHLQVLFTKLNDGSRQITITHQ